MDYISNSLYLCDISIFYVTGVRIKHIVTAITKIYKFKFYFTNEMDMKKNTEKKFQQKMQDHISIQVAKKIICKKRRGLCEMRSRNFTLEKILFFVMC